MKKTDVHRLVNQPIPAICWRGTQTCVMLSERHHELWKREESKNCVSFSDADWAGDINDRKSTSGYLLKISGGAVSWRSKKQECVALSTTEAEYVALASAAQESVWLRKLIAELESPPKGPTTIFLDN